VLRADPQIHAACNTPALIDVRSTYGEVVPLDPFWGGETESCRLRHDDRAFDQGDRSQRAVWLLRVLDEVKG
jgi:hypothetical protein